MKRHKSLIPLSQDHHNGLMLAQLIKIGAPEYKGLPTDIIGKVKFTKESWEKELKLHFDNEEKILFPFIKGENNEIDLLIDEILDEHVQIKKLVSELDDSENTASILDQLGEILELHIRKEERILFEKLQTSCLDKLEKLHGKINPVNKACQF